MKKVLLLLFTLLLFVNISTSQAQSTTDTDLEKIKVLNLGVFHFGFTPDANKTDYDEDDRKSLKEIEEITRELSQFKPTIILVEEIPENQDILEQEYEKYRKNPSTKTKFAGTETQLLAFEIGRLAGTEKIIGIDHKLNYMYNADEFAERIDAPNYFMVKERLEDFSNKRSEVSEIGLKQKLKSMNTEANYNYLINVNADLLTYANSEDKFEGADEAAKFYQRNLRMFANINKIDFETDDRVLIISGAAHASFFNKFMSRSPIYKLVDLESYLK